MINEGKDAIYVDATGGKLGLTLHRDVGGSLYDFDDLACECRYCTNVCNRTCTCADAGAPTITRVLPRTHVERVWDGVVQVAGVTNCSDGSCLSQVNAPLNETFTLELCFTAQRPTGVQFPDGGTTTAGELPKVTLDCVKKTFQPQAGLVEIGPTRGATCATTADCKGDELCLDGACTAGCPANDYPVIGSAWNLYVPSPDNMGFFNQSTRGTTKVLSGTGTLTSVLYQGTSLQLSLARPGVGGEMLTGKVTVQLPPMTGAPLVPNTQVAVTVLDDGGSRPNRAVVLRDPTTNALLFAVDMAQGNSVTEGQDLTPIAITQGTKPIGCRQDGCGKLLFTTTTFASGGKSLELEPGRSGTLTLGADSYRFLNVSAGSYGTTRCDVTSLRPWALWRE